jgi:hypothetical protein
VHDPNHVHFSLTGFRVKPGMTILANRSNSKEIAVEEGMTILANRFFKNINIRVYYS